MSLTTSELGGGLTVVTERMPDARSVTLGFWVGTGSVDEPAALAGASHFLEHLLFKGTDRRSARDIAEAVDQVGGDLNAFTTKEYTAFYVRLLAEDLSLGLDILSDIMWSPAFRAEELEAERQVILEEILMHADEPDDLVHEVFGAALFPGHPLGRETLGDADTIGAMTRDEIAAFHATHYRPANLVFAAAGNLEHEAVAAGIEARLAGVAGGARPARTVPDVAPASRVVVHRPTEQAHLVVGVRGPDRDSEQRHAAAVLDHVLGGGMSSRLFQKVREERGLAYSVYSYRHSYEGAGALAVYAGTSPSRAAEVLGLIHEELDQVAARGVTPAELKAAQSHLRGSMALGLEDSGARMSRLGHNQVTRHRVPSLDEVVDRLMAVTVDDVAEAAASLLGGERTVAVVGPFDDGFGERQG